MTVRRTVDDLLAEARLGLDRVTPAEAFEAMRADAVLVDVRAQDERERQGVVPGAVHYPLSVVCGASIRRRTRATRSFHSTRA